MRLIDADALKKYMDDCGWCDNCPDKKRLCEMDCRFPDFCTHEWQRVIDEQPTIPASPWHRVEEPPLPNQDLWLHDEHGYYHVGYISTYRGYTEYIDMDGTTLHGIDYWMPIEPPKEDA